jgi:hypothetical protein
VAREHQDEASEIAQGLFPRHRSTAPVQWTGNQNYYDFVAGSLTWHEAKTAAEGMRFMGTPGHLATITSQSENDFILSSLGTGLE